MNSLSKVTAISAAMGLGSYLAGIAPLVFRLSDTQLSKLSIFGGGLLIGAAFNVIMFVYFCVHINCRPEGIDTLYSLECSNHNNNTGHG